MSDVITDRINTMWIEVGVRPILILHVISVLMLVDSDATGVDVRSRTRILRLEDLSMFVSIPSSTLFFFA